MDYLLKWDRREYFEHFINEVVCTYSVVVNLDITNLQGVRLLPVAIQVHHTVCDGYHVGVFVEKLQEKIHFFGK